MSFPAVTQATGRALKKLIQSDAAYRILDGACGGTWLAGGCALLAVALEQAGAGALWVLVGRSTRNSPPQVQHWLVRTPGGLFLDGDGVSSEMMLLKRWAEIEDVLEPMLRPAEPGDRHGETWISAQDTTDVRSLVKLLRTLQV